MAAEGDAVVSVGGSAVLPGHDVVDVCPAGWAVAAGEGAAAAAEEDGDAGGAGVGAAARPTSMGIAAPFNITGRICAVQASRRVVAG